MKIRATLWPEADGDKEVSILNRIVRLGERCLYHEADRRHVEKLLKEAGLDDCESLNTLGAKDVSVTSPLDDDHVPHVSPGAFRYLVEHRKAERSIEKK